MDIETQLIDAEPIVRRIERDPEIATDLYQDLWLACLKRSNIDWSVPQVGRIVLIAQRLQVDRFRRIRRSKRNLVESVAAKNLLDDCQAEDPGMEAYELVLATLNDLPTKYRRAIEQKYVIEQPDELLAIELGVNAITIRKWRSRGIQELRARLRKCVFPNDQ